MLTVFLTEDCNLRCDYCPYEKKKNLLSVELHRRFLDLLFPEIKKTLSLVDFMGGEPLLYPKRLMEIVSETDKMFPNIRFRVSSNMTLLNKEILNIYKSKVEVIVSIDGRKERHDRHRRFINGAPSYELAIKNLKELTKYQDKIQVTFTFDPKDGPFSFVDEIQDIINTSPETEWVFDIRTISQEQDNYYPWIIDSYLEATDYFIKQFKSGKRIYFVFVISAVKAYEALKQKSVIQNCSLGYSEFALFPNGDLWPCLGYFNIKRRKLGNILKDNPNKIKKKIKSLQILNLMIKKKYKNKQCNCPINDICNKSTCIAMFEESNFKCPRGTRNNAIIQGEITKRLFSMLNKNELEKIKRTFEDSFLSGKDIFNI